MRPHYNLDSIRIQSRSTETGFNPHQSRPHYTTVCGQRPGIRYPHPLTPAAIAHRIVPTQTLVVSTRRLRTAKRFFIGATGRPIHCKPVTAADLDQAGLLVGAILQAITTDADQGRYPTNPKQRLSMPQRPSQTPRVDFHGRAHNESSF